MAVCSQAGGGSGAGSALGPAGAGGGSAIGPAGAGAGSSTCGSLPSSGRLLAAWTARRARSAAAPQLQQQGKGVAAAVSAESSSSYAAAAGVHVGGGRAARAEPAADGAAGERADHYGPGSGWSVHRGARWLARAPGPACADGAPAAIVARDAPGHASLARSPVMVSVCVCVCVCDAPVMSHSLGVP